MLFDKPVSTITKEDIEALVANGTREDRFLDFKDGLPLEPRWPDAKKAELHADVAAMANAGGGLLVYGVRERREEGKTTGVAEAAVGLEYNRDALRRAIMDSLDGGIDERVHGIEFSDVEDFPSGSVFLIRVPRSWRGPHRVKHTGAFPVRADGGNRILNTSEIRGAFATSDGVADKLKRFRDERIGRVVAGETPVHLDDGPKAILHVVPLEGLEPGRALNIEGIRNHRRYIVPITNGGAHVEDRFNLDGYVAYAAPKNPYTYVQLFRGGGLEAVSAYILRSPNDVRFKGHGVFRTVAIERALIDALRSYFDRMPQLGVKPPLSVMLSLTGVRGYILDADLDDAFHGDIQTPVDRDVLTLPDVLVSDFAERSDAILRPVFDALWQAAGRDGCAHYDADGKWKGP